MTRAHRLGAVDREILIPATKPKSLEGSALLTHWERAESSGHRRPTIARKDLVVAVELLRTPLTLRIECGSRIPGLAALALAAEIEVKAVGHSAAALSNVGVSGHGYANPINLRAASRALMKRRALE